MKRAFFVVCAGLTVGALGGIFGIGGAAKEVVGNATTKRQMQMCEALYGPQATCYPDGTVIHIGNVEKDGGADDNGQDGQ